MKSRWIKTLPILIFVLVAHLILLLNLKFTAWPEMLLWPYLVIKGWLPYQDIAIAHTPLLTLTLTLFYKFFGVGLLQLKIFTVILILFTDLTLFWVVKKLWGRYAAIVSLIFYLPLQIFYEGSGLWFDLALAPLGLFIFYSVKRRNFFGAGLAWALSFLVKQTAFWFLVPIFFAISGVAGKPILQKLRGFIQGILIVLIPFLILFWGMGILPEFYFWAIKFGVGILPRAEGQISLPGIKSAIFSFLPFLIYLFASSAKKKEGGLLVWTLAGLMGIIPRWELFHFQPAIPFLAIAAGLNFANLGKLKPRVYLIFLFYLALTSFFLSFILSFNLGRKARFFDQKTLEIAKFVSRKASPDEKIFVLNVWEHVYVLSSTLPSIKPWVPHLAWYMEMPGIQEEIVADLSVEKPRLMVVGDFDSGGLALYKPQKILDFIYENYVIEDKIGEFSVLVPKK